MCSSICQLLAYILFVLINCIELIFYKDLILDGFNCSQVVLQLHNILIRRTDISDAKKAVIFEKMAEVDFNLIEGADDYLQLLDLLAVLMCQMTKTF